MELEFSLASCFRDFWRVCVCVHECVIDLVVFFVLPKIIRFFRCIFFYCTENSFLDKQEIWNDVTQLFTTFVYM